MLIPTYKPLQKREKPSIKNISVWTEEASSTLQDCFECTDWDVFKEASTYNGYINLEEYASSVTGFISKCVDDVVPTRTITVRPNQRPWLNANVHALLKACDEAFRAGDKVALRAARINLTCGIREAKRSYASRIKQHFNNNDPQSMWKGIQCITDYRHKNHLASMNLTSLPDILNEFYV